ncbi:MAG TPA: hypothetical protein PKD96_03660 [Candidatus Absconditabacterales bacterium]|nr:hypothetical protein [Candidatus Absconditabacterales bacterium]HMT27376.1 hypothetical protein [Candidatus Absconditabacterales bacterium]
MVQNPTVELQITPEKAKTMLQIATQRKMIISIEAEVILKSIEQMDTEKNYIRSEKVNMVSFYDLKQLEKHI